MFRLDIYKRSNFYSKFEKENSDSHSKNGKPDIRDLLTNFKVRKLTLFSRWFFMIIYFLSE